MAEELPVRAIRRDRSAATDDPLPTAGVVHFAPYRRAHFPRVLRACLPPRISLLSLIGDGGSTSHAHTAPLSKEGGAFHSKPRISAVLSVVDVRAAEIRLIGSRTVPHVS